MQVLHDLGAEMRQDPYFRRVILEPLEVAGVDRFADAAVVIKARFKTRPLRQWDVTRRFNRRIKNRFDELGIEIPFPPSRRRNGRAPPGRSTRTMPSPLHGSGRLRRSRLTPGLIGHGRAVTDAAGGRCPQRPTAGTLASFALLLAGCTEELRRRGRRPRPSQRRRMRRRCPQCPINSRSKASRILACALCWTGVGDPATDRPARQPDQVAPARRG